MVSDGGRAGERKPGEAKVVEENAVLEGQLAMSQVSRRSATNAAPTPEASHLRRSLRIQLLATFVGLPVNFTAWVVLSRLFDLDAVFAARGSWVTATPIALVIIFAPLFVTGPWQARWSVFVRRWFCFTSLWIFAWQFPAVVFRDAWFTGVEYTQDNLPYYIWWLGYFSVDSDYGAGTRWFVLAEIVWWWIVIPIVAALIQHWRGREAQALALFGVSGALQFYNVCIYMAYGGIVQGFSIVASDSILAPLLYWGLNGIWGVAAGIASVLAFVHLFRVYVRDPASCATSSGPKDSRAV